MRGPRSAARLSLMVTVGLTRTRAGRLPRSVATRIRSHHASGCLVTQPLTASSSAASEISSGSLSAGPINCTPIGSPSEVNPAGTLIDGQPSRFHGQVTGQARIIARSVDRPPRLSKWFTVGGGSAVVGARTTSTRLKIVADAALRGRFLGAGLAQHVLGQQPAHPKVADGARGPASTSWPRRSAQSSRPDVDRDRKFHDIPTL